MIVLRRFPQVLKILPPILCGQTGQPSGRLGICSASRPLVLFHGDGLRTADRALWASYGKHLTCTAIANPKAKAKAKAKAKKKTRRKEQRATARTISTAWMMGLMAIVGPSRERLCAANCLP